LIVETASSRDGPGWNLQAVVLVERDSFRRPRPSVAEDHGLADKFGIGSIWRMSASRHKRPFEI